MPVALLRSTFDLASLGHVIVGMGAALLWPLNEKCFFFSFFFWRPIPVAPIGAGMLSERGLRVLLVELVAFAPVLLYAIWPRPEAKRAAP